MSKYGNTENGGALFYRRVAYPLYPMYTSRPNCSKRSMAVSQMSVVVQRNHSASPLMSSIDLVWWVGHVVQPHLRQLSVHQSPFFQGPSCIGGSRLVRFLALLQRILLSLQSSLVSHGHDEFQPHFLTDIQLCYSLCQYVMRSARVDICHTG